MSFYDGEIVTMVKDCEDDARPLCFFPFGVVVNTENPDTVQVTSLESNFERDHTYQRDEVDSFLLDVQYDEENPYLGYLVDFDPRLDLMEIEDSETGEIHTYHIDYLNDNIFIVTDAEKIQERYRRLPQLKESLKTLAKMQQVSKEGTIAHLPVNPNVQGKILSYLSGYNVGVPREGAHTKIIQEYLSRPVNALGAGVNKRYGKKMPIYVPPTGMNKALELGPLPYGPTEENFQGGKRSGAKREISRGKIGKQMARRGTRRSRGIFSRLYAPIGHLLSAGKESVGAVTNTAKGVVGEGIHGLDKIGRSVTKHANMAVKDVFTRKGGKRKASGTRKSRKSRRNTRRRR